MPSSNQQSRVPLIRESQVVQAEKDNPEIASAVEIENTTYQVKYLYEYRLSLLDELQMIVPEGRKGERSQFFHKLTETVRYPEDEQKIGEILDMAAEYIEILVDKQYPNLSKESQGVREKLIESEYNSFIAKKMLLDEVDKAYHQVLREGGKAKVDLYREVSNQKIRQTIKENKQNEAVIRAVDETKKDEILQTEESLKQRLGGIPQRTFDRYFKNKFAKRQPTLYGESIKAYKDSTLKEFFPAYVHYLMDMRNLRRMLVEGRVVETDYVRKIIEEAKKVLTKNPPGIVYLHGDYGSGKTAIAVHISKTRFKKDPVVVSGSKFLEPDRFTEEFRITKEDSENHLKRLMKSFGFGKISENADSQIDQLLKILGGKEAVRKQMAGLRKADLGRNLDWNEQQEIEKLIDQAFSNNVEGRYVLGAMYKAMQEGRPLIIDEANAITPEVLIAFNDLITKKIGEKVKTRTDEKEFEIKPGFCVIWTGNTGERYSKGRYNDMDAATFSRIHGIKVHYLPQSKEINAKGELTKRLKIADLAGLETELIDGRVHLKDTRKSLDEIRANSKNDQIFQVLLLKFLNRQGGVHLLVPEENPYQVFEQLYELSMGARIIMDIFEGSIENFQTSPALTRILGDGTVSTIKSTLQKTNLSMRQMLDDILAYYLGGNQMLDLEYQVFEFIKRSAQFPKEMAILYEVFKKVGFFTDTNWPELDKIVPASANKEEALAAFENAFAHFDPLSTIPKYQKITFNGYSVSLHDTELARAQKMIYRYFSSMETLQMLYGYLPPRTLAEYQELAQLNKQKKKEDMDEKALENDIRNKIALASNMLDFDDIEQQCSKFSGDERIQKIKLIGEKIRNYLDNSEDMKIEDASYLESISLDKLNEIAIAWAEAVLQIMLVIKEITPEERQQFEEGTASEKLDVVIDLIKK